MQEYSFDIPDGTYTINLKAGVFVMPDPLPDGGGDQPPPGDPGSGGHAPTRPGDDEDENEDEDKDENEDEQ